MNETIIATDPGNGKASTWFCKDGNLKFVNIPHARVRTSGYQIEKGSSLIGQHKVDFADWQGQRFGFGEGVWDIATQYPVETFQNSEHRYGADLHVFLIVLGLALVGAPNNTPLTLVVPVPPSSGKPFSKSIYSRQTTTELCR